MADITIKLVGFKELEDRLKAFPVRFRGNAMRGGMRAGLKILVKGARNRVPKKTRQLEKTIRSSTRSFDNGNRLVGKVSAGGVNRARKGKAFYAHILERGARAHVIKPKRADALSFGGRFAKEVRHPGIKPRRFMERTATADGPKAEIAFEKYVLQRVATYLDPK